MLKSVFLFTIVAQFLKPKLIYIMLLTDFLALTGQISLNKEVSLYVNKINQKCKQCLSLTTYDSKKRFEKIGLITHQDSAVKA